MISDADIFFPHEADTLPSETKKKVRLLEAAQSLFFRQGFQSTTLADISRESGISLGNLYTTIRQRKNSLAM
ncbi:hypothetical protein A7E78_00070 [Syntrophotalea acetylenivorans]|uniref:HTH tetR-type domain-containing protein n=1 Tax=Syntrophotalea acetylenivorans TaxID=1842532 RepID=A0A1L3GKG9_9BACT|nr:hypothetical protein A7E78_00070 [Syntrophotalea acetylenivorans]